MRLIIKFFSFVVIIILCFNMSSCGIDDEPDSVTTTVTMINVDYTSESATISFTANRDWSVTSNQSWCTVSQASGKAGTYTLSIFCDSNNTYEERNAIITITCGTAFQNITINQKQHDAILVTSNKIEINSEGGDVSIDVKANVNYEVSIDDDAKDWITVVSTRALTTYNIMLHVSANENLNNREGKVTIFSGDNKEIITIYQQGETPSIVLSQDEITVSSSGETVKVELQSNINVSVQMPNVNWISQVTTRSMSSSTYYFEVSKNDDYDSRSAEIAFTNTDNGITKNVKITQSQKDAIILNSCTYTLNHQQQALDLDLQTNVEFTINIDCDWIKQTEGTRALEVKNLHFNIEANRGENPRVAKITFENANITQTVTITQLEPIYNIETPGTLEQLLQNDNALETSFLKITGTISNKDILTIRNLKNLSILNLKGISNSSLPDNAFEELTNLNKLIFPYNLLAIPNKVCHKCSSLKTIEYFNNVKTIGEQAFLYCNLQGTIDIYDNVTSIGNQAFEENNLDSIIIGNGIQTIPLMAFSYNRTLKYVKFGNNVQYFNDGCFNSCDDLTGYIDFPSKTKFIGKNAFTSYNTLKNIKGFICRNPEPPELQSDALPKYEYLLVPKGSKTKYENAANWKNFLVIEEMQ